LNSPGTKIERNKPPLSFYTPLLAQWDITSGCNFKCTFCLSNSGRRLTNELDWEQARVVVDRLHEGGVIFLRILGGEPFYRKDILKVMQLAADKGMLLSFSTNASLVSEKYAEQLKEIEDSINYFQVSLYGTDTPAYERQTLDPRGFDLVRRGIANLKKYDLNPFLFWVLTADNMDQLEAAYNLTREWELPTLRISLKLNIGRGTADCSDSVNNPQLWSEAVRHFSLLNQLVIKYGSPTIQLHARPLLGEFLYRRTGLPYFYITCKAASTMVYLDANGECSPCPFAAFMPDSYLYPLPSWETMSILKHKLADIWQSGLFERYRELRNPDNNPGKMFRNCPHFKSGICDPCIFTPCTCRETIEMVKTGGSTVD
jgi:MoaA/NifB/PqqE/SkfB family radical SAM enzyme